MKKLYHKAFFISGSDIWTQRAHISNYEVSLVWLSTENLSCYLSFCLTMRCFERCFFHFLTMFQKNAKHRANDASSDVHLRPPLNSSPSLPNHCLWYDKLWRPSQRVVTLFPTWWTFSTWQPLQVSSCVCRVPSCGPRSCPWSPRTPTPWAT